MSELVLTEVEHWALYAVNRHRIEASVSPVTPNEALQCAAQWQLDHTMATGTQSHTFNGTTPGSRAESCGYVHPVQENVVAWAKSVINADERLEASSVHAFIRRRHVQIHIGIAVACDVNRVEGDYAGAKSYPCAQVEVYGRGK